MEEWKIMEGTKETKTPKGPKYRALSTAERDLLFSFYDKHNGNMLAMVRDPDCYFDTYNVIRHYSKIYEFQDKLIKNRQKKAQRVLDSLEDSKMAAIEQAIGLIRSKFKPLLDKNGRAVLDKDGQPIFIEIEPDSKSIKTGWEIIKTELGQATAFAKLDHTTKGDKVSVAAINYILPDGNNNPANA